jgi:hypothetical protein
VAVGNQPLRFAHHRLSFLQRDPVLDEGLREQALVLGAARRTVFVDLAVTALQRRAALREHLRTAPPLLRGNAEGAQTLQLVRLEPHVAEEAAIAAQAAAAAEERERRFG